MTENGGIGVNEKNLALLEQYDLQVKGFRRGRGAYVLDTDQGLKLFAEFSGTERRLLFQNRICEKLEELGTLHVDRVRPSKEGSLIVKDRDEQGYIVKDWFEGRECSTRSEEDILKAVKLLAQIHGVLQISDEEVQGRFVGMPFPEECIRKLREMKKTRTYMRGRSQKSPFERRFLDTFDLFYDQAENICRELEKWDSQKLFASSVKEGKICHGDYNHHHVYLAGTEAAVMDFNRARYDVQILDLYQILRKMMEKQNWDVRFGKKMLETYEKVRPLSEEEYRELSLRLTFPEKFWKLANHYYNGKKAKAPEKGMEKLETLAVQEEYRQNFLKAL